MIAAAIVVDPRSAAPDYPARESRERINFINFPFA
jgi:hypothetical protein